MIALVVLGSCSLVLLLPLIVAALRQRSLATMAVRNIDRRRAEAALVVAGALLGTAIITSSFVVGDVIEGSFADTARTRYGPVDLTVSPVDGTGIDAIAAAVEAADIAGIDGLLAATVGSATLEAPARGAALPRVDVVELDVTAASSFGAEPGITGLVGVDDLTAGTIVVNRPTASRLDVRAGDTIRLHAYGSQVDLEVAQVVAEVGLAGYGGAIVAPDTFDRLTAAGPVTPIGPVQRLFVSLDGGVFDTRQTSDTVLADVRTAVAGLPGVEVAATKADVLDAAGRDSDGLTAMFGALGAFSVLAGILLLVNLFVMLAEERKTELGMLRAVGFTRRRLTRAFAIEGAIYAAIAAAAGAIVGVGIGWVVAVVAGPILAGTDQAASYPLVVEPTSLAMGAATGLVISLVTVWATSWRIARLNIIRAIRDLPEPKVTIVRTRTLVLAAAGVLVGGVAAVTGYLGDQAIPLAAGVPMAAFCATPLLRRLLPERPARLLTAGTALGWALVANVAFDEAMGAAGMSVFVVQGVVLTAAAVSIASSLDRLWTLVIERLARGGRGLAPRLGLAYPLARRFRTAMLLAMFSLVVFTVTILTTMSAAMEGGTDATIDRMAAGFDIVLDTDPASPADVTALAARDDVVTVAGLSPGMASFEASHLDAARVWPITGFDAGLLEHGTPGLVLRDGAYASDEAAFTAVLDDPSLAIVPENFLAAGVEFATLGIGDPVTVTEPATGATHELTIVGIGEFDWIGNGALVSRELTASLFGTRDVVARTYLSVADGVDAEHLAASLNADLLPSGADARTFAALGTAGVGGMTGFISLMQGFLGLGLLVGIAGLGVVMVRAVRERRQEIGMLRAMGFRTGIVRAALLSEAGLIAVQGTVIGATLGLVTSWQIMGASDAFGEGVAFAVPWAGLAMILALPLLAALAATAWPASRAAAIRPAIALRTAG